MVVTVHAVDRYKYVRKVRWQSPGTNFCLFVCVCPYNNCRRIVMTFLAVGSMTNNNWLDIGGDPNHGAERGILNGIFTIVGYGQFCAQLHKQRLQCLWGFDLPLGWWFLSPSVSCCASGCAELFQLMSPAQLEGAENYTAKTWNEWKMERGVIISSRRLWGLGSVMSRAN